MNQKETEITDLKLFDLHNILILFYVVNYK